MQPENYVEAPDLGVIITTSPGEERFWAEIGQSFAWAKYVWIGPKPVVKVDLGKIYPGLHFSSKAIYQGIIDGVSALNIPAVKIGPQIIHEAGPFSPHRAYLSIRRELSEYLVCAAPVGKSFFITVRKIDRFRHVKWWHYILLFWFLLNLLAAGYLRFGQTGGLVWSALWVSLVWSILRYASHEQRSWLGEKIPQIPIIGGLYLRWFRPDTYFRQDLQAAFMSLVDGAIEQVIVGLDPAQPVRPSTETQGVPVHKDLSRKA